LAMPAGDAGAGRAEQRFDDILVGHHSAALSIVSP
jgi:hypothetical protein